jgi:hypothetical protein
MAMKLPKLAGPKPIKTGLGGSVSGVAAPSGVNKGPETPMIDRRQNVGQSNVTKTRWSPTAGINRKMGNH